MSILINPHPRVQDVDASSFDYSGYAWRAIRTRLDSGVLVIELYRPSARNAFNNEMAHDLVFAFELADQDRRVKAAVLTGHGNAFCFGADLGGNAEGFGTDANTPINLHRDGGGQVALSIAHCRKLTIAAVNGHAIGIGFTMLLPCDIRIVAAEAKISAPFAKRGITMEAGSCFILPRLVGHANALDIVLTGDVLPSGYRALSALWREILPSSEVLPAALKLATRLASQNSVVSMAICKNLIWHAPTTVEEAHLLDSKAIAATSNGDAKEGVLSFMEKREPRFPGTIDDLEKFSFYPWWTEVNTTSTITRGRGHKL